MSGQRADSGRRKLIAKVHVAKKQMGLDDDVYRAILHRVTGRDSAAGLSADQLGTVVAELRRLGWEPRTAKGKRPSDNPQVRMIWAMWTEMGELGAVRAATRSALRTFVLNRTGVSDPEWLSQEQAKHVIEALQAWKRRELAKAR